MRRIESPMIAGPAGRIEALLEEPDEEPKAAALVCHPHPQHGGTMHTKVVYRTARALRKAGAVVLRFNYRGVNLSEGRYDNGVGELDDARASLAWLGARYPGLPVLLAGFSFGSRIAMKLASETQPRQVIAVGFPTGYADRDEYIHGPVPRVFIQSTGDQFGPRAEFEPMVQAARGDKRMVWVEAADHFFSDALDELEEAVRSSAAVD